MMNLILVLAELTAEEAFTLLVGRSWTSSRWQRSALRGQWRILSTATTTAELNGLAGRWCGVLWCRGSAVLTLAHVDGVSIIVRTTLFHNGVISVRIHGIPIHWFGSVYWLHDAIGAVERAVFARWVGVGVPRTSAVATSCCVVWLVVALLTVTTAVMIVSVVGEVVGVAATKAILAWGCVRRLAIWIEVVRATTVVVATSRRLVTSRTWAGVVAVVAGAATG